MAANPENVISIYSALLSRAELMAKLGYQYGGDRDVYEALGYITDLDYADYSTQYLRQDMAKAIIDRPVEATWRGGFIVVESDKVEDTEFEKAFAKLYKSLSLQSRFMRLDRLTGLGQYGVLLMGLSDAKRQDDFQKPVRGVGHQLMYLKSYGEGNAAIAEYETDPSNERYGLPLLYDINVENLSTKTTTTLRVHYSRVVHVVDGPMESEIEGTPRLQAVFNRLQDLEKIVGASAEMFWRGARPGYQGKIDKDAQMTTADKEELQDQLDEFEHNLRRLLILQNMSLDSLSPQVADPSNHVDIQIQMISAVTGIPKRILTGSERGELASTEDKNTWFGLIDGRRGEFAEPCIIRPFVDRCIEYGIIPKPKADYGVKWPDLWATGDKEKAEIGRIRATALKEYATMPTAESIIPPPAFLKVIMGLRDDEIELIGSVKESEVSEEELGMEGAEEEGGAE